MHIIKRILLLFSLLPVFLIPAQNHTISGYITDKDTGEPLISASVFDTQSLKGTAGNNYGFYSLTLPKGEVSLNYSYIGYRTENISFSLQKDTVIHIRLSLQNMLEEVTVVGHRSEIGVQGSQMSAVEVPISQIKNIPTIFGENDLIKALQLLPGVQAGTEGSAGLYVRGGGLDENLLLLDGVPIYNVNHMFGFFSVFNSDALKNVTLYKGSFPARFGGRLSSVVDIRMKDGDDKKVRGSASIGVISSKMQVEGPIIKEKTTFNISARRTYIDLLTRPLLKAYAKKEDESNRVSAGYYFYDINAKFTHKISDRDKLFLSVYTGDDAMYAKVRTNYTDMPEHEEKNWSKLNWGWGNLVTALRWNHVINRKLFMNTTASFTRYRSDLRVAVETEEIFKGTIPPETATSETSVKYDSGIGDWTLKTDFDYSLNPSNDIKFGVSYTHHTFSPDVSALRFSSSNTEWENLDTIVGSPKVYAHETMAFVEDNISLGDIFKVNLGAHFSSFHVQEQNYFSLQPRVGLRIRLDDNLSFKAGYAYMKQYVHMLSNSSVSLPTDLWVPVTKKIKPMFSHQYAAGFFYSLRNIAEFSVEGYYKTMDNLLEYKDGASFLGVSTQWEEKVNMGKGIAYGIEFLMHRTYGNTTGWLGYTWAKSDRIFDRPGNIINNGKPFPAKYDRRHDLSLTVSHKFSHRFDIAATWIYSTGNTGTFGYHEYQNIPAPNYPDLGLAPYVTTHIESRNNFRFNDYHRLDLGVNFHKTTRRGNLRTWNIGIYNVYNQLNPFMVFTSSSMVYNPQTGNTEEEHKLMQASLFPIIPSISYTLQF